MASEVLNQRDRSRSPPAQRRAGSSGGYGYGNSGFGGFGGSSAGYSSRYGSAPRFGGGNRFERSGPYNDRFGPYQDRLGGGNNFNRRNEMRPGDWICVECDQHNFRNKTECFGCKIPKPDNARPAVPPGHFGQNGFPPPHGMMGGRRDMGPPSEREVRPGDWQCVDCNYSNFASRTTCNKCNKLKPDNAPLTADLKNWECTSCGASNHSKRYDCFKCQEPKRDDAKTVDTLMDWCCPQCGANNAARRTNCIGCDRPRPGREKELEKSPDWKCGSCGINNWSWRPSCYKCFHQREVSQPKRENNENGDGGYDGDRGQEAGY